MALCSLRCMTDCKSIYYTKLEQKSYKNEHYNYFWALGYSHMQFPNYNVVYVFHVERYYYNKKKISIGWAKKPVHT